MSTYCYDPFTMPWADCIQFEDSTSLPCVGEWLWQSCCVFVSATV